MVFLSVLTIGSIFTRSGARYVGGNRSRATEREGGHRVPLGRYATRVRESLARPRTR